MKKIILFALSCSCFALLVSGCPSTDTIEPRVHFESLTSIDPSLSVPQLELAIKQRDGNAVLLAWLLGGNSETRTAAIEYYLSLETEDPEVYERMLDEIVNNIDARKAEIRSVWRKIQKERAKP